MGRPLKKKLKTIVRKTRRALLNFAGENQDTVALGGRNATIDAIQAERASTNAIEANIDRLRAQRPSHNAITAEIDRLRAQRASNDAMRADLARLRGNTAQINAETARAEYRTGMIRRSSDAIARYRQRQIDRIRAETATLRAQNNTQRQRLENNNIFLGYPEQ